MTWDTQRFEQWNSMNRGMVGKLPVKKMSHWRNIDTQYWTDNCNLELQPTWGYGYGWRDRKQLQKCNVEVGMVRLQHALVAAGKCKGGKMNLAGELTREYWKKRQEIDYYRCPYHEDLLENWGKHSFVLLVCMFAIVFVYLTDSPTTTITEAFVEDLKNYEDGIERFSISNVMLPSSPFFSTNIMPVITANISTITSLELESCHLQSTDVELVSKFIKKNKLLGVLNLSQNELFGIDDCVAANQLSKAMKKHPELSFVNLSKTGLGANNEALKLILEGSKGINSLIIDDNALDKDGLTMVTDFLQKKNAITEFSMASSLYEDEENISSCIPKAKALKQCLQNNTTLEQLCLGSNLLGCNNRIFSTVMSGIKGSVSLVHLDLSDNGIRNLPSVKLVAKYLARNPALIELDMSNNWMVTKSANVLIESLKKNTTLQHLSLKNNSMNVKIVPAIVDMLQNNSTLRSLNVQHNKVHNKKWELFNALCDPTSLDSIMNKSNHTCSIILNGRNQGNNEEELNSINQLKNEGEKIRYKVVLAASRKKDLYDPRSFEDVSLEIMPKVLELVQLEIGYNGYGKEITRKNLKEKDSRINRLNNVYETIHQWPAFPSLFARGPGKGSLTKTGKLKRKREKRAPKVTDEDEDWAPSGARQRKKRSVQSSSSNNSSSSIVVGSGRSRRSSAGTSISYADVENSEDES